MKETLANPYVNWSRRVQSLWNEHGVKKDSHMALPSYAWPGGYPVVYLDHDNSSICPECANKADWTDAFIRDWFIHYEGPAEQCANCDDLIASAYGDPDTEER